MSKTIIKTINSSCRITKYIGLFPFYLTADGSLKISIFWLIWSVILLGLLSVGAIWISYVRTSIDYENNQFMKEIIYVTALLSAKNITAISFLLLHTIWLLVNRKKLESVFKLLIKLEEKVPTMTGRWHQIITYSLVLLNICSELYPFWFFIFFIVVYTLVNMVPSALEFAALYQFIDLLQLCRYHFSKISSTFTEIKSAPVVLTPKSRKSKLLDQCEKNNELIGCCETMNYCFGPLLLMAVINCFAEISTSLFILYQYWNILSSDVFFMCIWILVFGHTFRYLLASCENTVNAANEFYVNLAETLVYCDELSNEPCFLVTLISRKTLKFTTFGFFTIDYGMFFSIMAASITYFLVFIQFNTLSVETKAQLNATRCE